MCGVGLVARLDGCACHETIARALTVLANMEHRGAAGADADTGDGAGILLQLPDAFLRASVPFALPEHGRYGVGVCFLPQLAKRRSELERLLEETVAAEGLTVLGWRDVPMRRDQAGRQAQLFAPAEGAMMTSVKISVMARAASASSVPVERDDAAECGDRIAGAAPCGRRRPDSSPSATPQGLACLMMAQAAVRAGSNSATHS